MSNKEKQSAASRRDFLKVSTAAAVGSAFAANLAAARNVHAAGSDVIRIGLIGCGGRGTGAVSQALATEGPVKLVAVGDAFAYRLQESMNQLTRRKDLAEKIDVPKERQFVGLDAYKKVIASDVDLVILATPPGFRPLHLAAAVEAGKHVFMEKPVAVDAPGVRSVLESTRKAKEKKLAIGVGLQRRHQLTYLDTIKRLQDGIIGDIHTMRVYWNGKGVWVRTRESSPPEIKTDMQYQVNNWYYFNWLSGDHICEQHIHNLDVCNWLKNAYPIAAQGMGGRQVRTGEEYGEIFDHHAVEFEYADGSRMFSWCRHMPGCWDSVSEHCQGTKGSSDISRAMIQVAGKELWTYRGPKNNPYQTEHDDLFASIRNGNPLNEGEFGAMSSMTAILGRMCTYSGKMIRMDEALASNDNTWPAPNGEELTWDTKPPVPSVPVPGVTNVLG